MSEKLDICKSIEELKKDFNKGLLDFNKELLNIDKQLKQVEQQQKVSVADFQKVLDDTLKTWKKQIELDTSQIINMKSSADGSTFYKATITALGSITEEYPPQQPSNDDVYWARYKEQVDNALTVRKEIILKIIETVGTTVGGILNPTKAATSGD